MASSSWSGSSRWELYNLLSSNLSQYGGMWSEKEKLKKK
jgi:hypothetical protein